MKNAHLCFKIEIFYKKPKEPERVDPMQASRSLKNPEKPSTRFVQQSMKTNNKSPREKTLNIRSDEKTDYLESIIWKENPRKSEPIDELNFT